MRSATSNGRSSERVYRLSNPLHDDRIEFSLKDLTHEEEMIISSLPFSDVDEESELLFLRNLALKLHEKLKDGTEDLAADVWDAERFLRRTNCVEKCLEDLDRHQFHAPTHDARLKRVRSALKIKDMVDTVRFRFSDISRVANFSGRPFPKEISTVASNIGMVSNVIDFCADTFIPIYKAFRPKQLHEADSAGKRLLNHLNKDSRPMRLFGSTLGIGLTITGYFVAGTMTLVLGVVSPVIFFGMTCFEVWRENNRYNNIIKKIDAKIEYIKKFQEKIEFRIQELQHIIDLNKKNNVPDSRSETDANAIEINSLTKESAKCDHEIRSLYSIRKKTEVKKSSAKSANKWKIGRSFVLSSGLLLCMFLVPHVAVIIAWGLLAFGVCMFAKKAYDYIQESRELSKIEKERKELEEESKSDPSTSLSLTSSPRSSTGRLHDLGVGLLAPQSPKVSSTSVPLVLHFEDHKEESPVARTVVKNSVQSPSFYKRVTRPETLSLLPKVSDAANDELRDEGQQFNLGS